jgi:hypothetical protein
MDPGLRRDDVLAWWVDTTARASSLGNTTAIPKIILKYQLLIPITSSYYPMPQLHACIPVKYLLTTPEPLPIVP